MQGSMDRGQRMVVLGVAAAVVVLGVALIVVVLAGGGGKGASSAGHPTSTGLVATTAPQAPSSAPTTTPVPTSSTSVPSAVGLVVNGSGNTFTSPSAPTVVPFSADCRALVDPGFFGQCLTVSAPTGTIAAIVEQQRRDYQPGQPIAAGQERDLVYRRQGATYALVLRRTPEPNGSGETRLYESDVNRDGDPKAVFVTPAPNARYGTELDLVEGSGVVTLYRQLHGGFAGVAAGGGLDSFVPDPSQGYDEAVIRFGSGAWRIVSDARVSDSQAQAQNAQPFNDPKGSMAAG